MLRTHRSRLRTDDRGIVLVVALIVLVAMTLGAIALVRSVYTGNLVAGNLAFQQSATHSADAGIETAIAWLENNNGVTTSATASACTPNTLPVLSCDQAAYGYLSARQDPAVDPSTQVAESWRSFWVTTLSAKARTLAADRVGNTVSYVIQRMCSLTGDAQSSTNQCATSPRTLSEGNCSSGSSCDSQRENLNSRGGGGGSGQIYYRITVRVVGPRNTESFTQAVVAL